MGWKYVPIYGTKEEGKSGYTIFIDLQTNRLYRGFHREVSQTHFMTAFLVMVHFNKSFEK